MKLVQHLLDSKGRDIISVTADVSVLDETSLAGEAASLLAAPVSGDAFELEVEDLLA